MASAELKQLERELEVAAVHFTMADQARIHLSEADDDQSALVSEARVVSAARDAMFGDTDLTVDQLLLEAANHPMTHGVDLAQWRSFLDRVRSRLRDSDPALPPDAPRSGASTGRAVGLVDPAGPAADERPVSVLDQPTDPGPARSERSLFDLPDDLIDPDAAADPTAASAVPEIRPGSDDDPGARLGPSFPEEPAAPRRRPSGFATAVSIFDLADDMTVPIEIVGPVDGFDEPSPLAAGAPVAVGDDQQEPVDRPVAPDPGHDRTLDLGRLPLSAFPSVHLAEEPDADEPDGDATGPIDRPDPASGTRMTAGVPIDEVDEAVFARAWAPEEWTEPESQGGRRSKRGSQRGRRSKRDSSKGRARGRDSHDPDRQPLEVDTSEHEPLERDATPREREEPAPPLPPYDSGPPGVLVIDPPRRWRRLSTTILGVAVVALLGGISFFLTSGNWLSTADDCDDGTCSDGPRPGTSELAIAPSVPPETSDDASDGGSADSSLPTEGPDPSEPDPANGADGPGETDEQRTPPADASATTEPSAADPPAPGTDADVRATPSTEVAAPSSSPTTAPATTTTAKPTTTTTARSTTTTTAAPSIGVACPSSGGTQDRNVTQVASDDVLNVRTGPGKQYRSVVGLAPDASGIDVYTGTTDGPWVMVAIPGAARTPTGGCGWVHSYYLA